MIASRSVNMVRQPRRSYIGILIAVSRVATPENNVIHWTCKGAQIRLTSGSWKGTVYPSSDSPNTSRCFAIGASNVCLWLVKIRRAPSRHNRDARAYGHTTTGMHQLSTPPSPLPPSSPLPTAPPTMQNNGGDSNSPRCCLSDFVVGGGAGKYVGGEKRTKEANRVLHLFSFLTTGAVLPSLLQLRKREA